MMERAEWLKRMRSMTEALYDHWSPEYWVNFGKEVDVTHREVLQKFLERIGPGSTVLSAGCGAGLYEGLLLEAGLHVVGIDQSEGMLEKARQHWPQVKYEKLGLQELAQAPAYQGAFDGVLCMDALEHVCPEDYPGILGGFQRALKPGGVLYFTVDDSEEAAYLQASYERAKALGLPVVYGEVADQVEANYERMMTEKEYPADLGDISVYHYHPPLEQVRDWLAQAGLVIEEEGSGQWYHHFIARKPEDG